MSEETALPRPGNNGFDPTKTKEFVDRILNLHGDIDKEKSAYMLKAKSIRGDMKIVYDEAKEAGLPKKELKAVIKTKLLEHKTEKVRSDLDADAQDTFDLIRHALGDLADTPLGNAAMQAAA